MLDGRGDNVIAAAGVSFRRALESQVVGFRGPAGENDLARIGADQFGHLPPGRLHALFGLPTEPVIPAGGIPEFLAEIGEHGLEHPGIDGRRSVVIHVNGNRHAYFH